MTVNKFLFGNPGKTGAVKKFNRFTFCSAQIFREDSAAGPGEVRRVIWSPSSSFTSGVSFFPPPNDNDSVAVFKDPQSAGLELITMRRRRRIRLILRNDDVRFYCPVFGKLKAKKIRRRMVTSVKLHCRMTNRVYDTLINDGFGFEG